jgi:hypothetical protein
MHPYELSVFYDNAMMISHASNFASNIENQSCLINNQGNTFNSKNLQLTLTQFAKRCGLKGKNQTKKSFI